MKGWCVMKVGEKAGCLLMVALAVAGVGLPVHSSFAQKRAMAGKPSMPKATTPTTGDWHPKSIAYIKASNTNKDDQFGSAIALSGDGNTLAVSATSEDSAAKGVNAPPKGSALNSGAVYVYTRTAAGWKQQAYVKASNTAEGAQFGNALALSKDGNLLVVASTGEASSAKVSMVTKRIGRWRLPAPFTYSSAAERPGHSRRTSRPRTLADPT